MEYQDLESKRLYLKRVDVCYAQDILDNFNRKITRYMYPKADESMGEVMAFITLSKKQAEAKTTYNYAIIEKGSNEFLGGCGYESGVSSPVVAFGIWIKESAHHHKFGLEAVQCLYENAKKHDEYESFAYYADRRNLGSRRIAEALGGICDEQRVVRSINGNGEDLEMLSYHIAR